MHPSTSSADDTPTAAASTQHDTAPHPYFGICHPRGPPAAAQGSASVHLGHAGATRRKQRPGSEEKVANLQRLVVLLLVIGPGKPLGHQLTNPGHKEQPSQRDAEAVVSP